MFKDVAFKEAIDLASKMPDIPMDDEETQLLYSTYLMAKKDPTFRKVMNSMFMIYALAVTSGKMKSLVLDLLEICKKYE